MNVDSLTRLIEAADVATLRTLSVIFLPLIGFDDAFFSDGPYDGGADFSLRTQSVNGEKVGFQLSVEKNWRDKIEVDADKAKRKHGISMLFFVSSRRIPEGSRIQHQADVAKRTGVRVVKYDAQAIATTIIQKNAVAQVLALFGIPIESQFNDELLTPKNEAVASLLVFGSDARDFREKMVDSLIKAYLARENYLERAQLIEKIVTDLGMSQAQGVIVNAGIDRLLQVAAITSESKRLSLSNLERTAFDGLRAATAFELASLKDVISAYLAEEAFEDHEKELILENLLSLVKALTADSYHLQTAPKQRDQIYTCVLGIISSRIGESKALSCFADLALIVAGSQFGKRVASVQLYEHLLDSNSRILTAALGGSRGISIFLDTPVFLPLLCGALFDPSRDRFGKSASDLLALLSEHEFSAVLPTAYLEESAVHLINACRHYRYLLEEGVDIQGSTNAFVSHFSSLKNSPGNEALTFGGYVAVFGINLEKLGNPMTDAEFFVTRERVSGELRRIAKKYRISVSACDGQYSWRAKRKIEEASVGGTPRAPILVEHDAKVIAYLEEQVSSSDDVLVMCTWDRIHSQINPEGAAGYYVMSPVGLIDFLSIGKRGDESAKVAVMIDFVEVVSEEQILASAMIWDAVAKISGPDLSDGLVLAQARAFRDDFMAKHASLGLIGEEDIAKSWLAWRNAKALAESR